MLSSRKVHFDMSMVSFFSSSGVKECLSVFTCKVGRGFSLNSSFNEIRSLTLNLSYGFKKCKVYKKKLSNFNNGYSVYNFSI